MHCNACNALHAQPFVPAPTLRPPQKAARSLTKQRPLLPACVQYVVTAWGLDQFSYGSYSYTKAPVNGEAGYTKAHLE
jgi:hypothetical protein